MLFKALEILLITIHCIPFCTLELCITCKYYLLLKKGFHSAHASEGGYRAQSWTHSRFSNHLLFEYLIVTRLKHQGLFCLLWFTNPIAFPRGHLLLADPYYHPRGSFSLISEQF